MSFIENLKEILNDEKQYTENGALGFRTTGKELLDANFAVSSMRNWDEQQIIDKFVKVFYENKLLAVKWLFYAADVREGIGERRLFRVCLKYLAEQHKEIAKSVIHLVAEYTRWDNLMCILDSELADDVVATIRNQLDEDMKNMKENKPISLLGKWMPSANASSKETKRLARILISKLGITERQYRKLLSAIRSYLKVVEVSMSAKEWSAINYAAVPSKANLIYNNAFLRNDEERRRAYLESLEKGETKINAGILFPHDIVHKYCENNVRYSAKVSTSVDITLEELWKALPDYCHGTGNTICVADGSGSMTCTIGNTNVDCLQVANALAIYFSERSSGQFKDNYITFSSHPQLVDFSNAKNLREKIEIALRYNEVSDTNMEATFDLILNTAIKNKMSQEDLPQNILVLSDMEFNSAVCGQPDKTLFQNIAAKYARYGYKMPRMVFWNICSRTGTIPVKENELGVALVSGFSPAIVKMVLSNSTDPLECLLEQINSERYAPVEEAIKKVVA
ncbi:MAG: DUF2828 family protein [Lachnospiraceae bacterium]|nr:DUF2828 family protein [Lachnospiraceae bacterium]